MSHSPTLGHHDHSTSRLITDDETIEQILGALNDADCRHILEAVSESDQPLSAAELSDTCGVPSSTTYRKLETLSEAGLVEERIRIRRSGKHTSEYAHHLEDVEVRIDPETGIELTVSYIQSKDVVAGGPDVTAPSLFEGSTSAD